MNAVSLFTGVGGADIAAQWAGIKVIAMSEIDEACCETLTKNFPDVPNLGDVKTITKDTLYEATGRTTTDIVYGGFPCQPYSNAGNQRGQEDDRHLWPEMYRIIKELKPTWVVGENVANFVNMALDSTLSDLEAEGYETRAFVLPACAVGAWHRRDRTFVVAYSSRFGDVDREPGEHPAHTRRGALVEPDDGDSCRHVPDTRGDGLEASECRSGEEPCEVREAQPGHPWDGVGMGGEGWLFEPPVSGMVDGVPTRLDKDRVKQLGNAIVPQVIYPIFKAIMDLETAL